MKADDQLDVLLKAFKEDSMRYRTLKPAKSREENRRLFRSLMNTRMPGVLPAEVLKLQDEYLQAECRDKGIVTIAEIPTLREQYNNSKWYSDRISLWRGDITRLAVDGIVNAANSQMLGCFVPCHGCIDNAIHSAAGIQLRNECYQLMLEQGHEEAVGGAKVTKAYNLPCKYVLHTVGPIIGGELSTAECRQLESCYESCLKLAEECGMKSVAFCCISTGEYHFPNDRAAQIAIKSVSKWLEHGQFERVIFNVFKEQDLKIYQQLL